ncbi:Sec-independent protein translocase protein TatB [Mesorhizobium sp. CAU 1732]|uniref:Sec-independent protein translocase protein TatB n=1 Tax=Mesorhizobium sp. CAU 1732 TaxID=3140358 RepID=UPI003261989B
MFDIGWSEMLVIAVVMIVVVGPKELPGMLRTFGKTTAKLRAMAGDFRKQVDEALKEAELDDLKKMADEARKLNPANEIRKAMSPMEQAAKDVRAGLDTAMNPTKPAPTTPPASTEAIAVEPLKPGAATIPGETAAPKSTPVPSAAKANGATPPAAKTASPKAAKPAAAKAAAKAPAAKAPVAKTVSKPKAAPKAAAKPKTGGKAS